MSTCMSSRLIRASPVPTFQMMMALSQPKMGNNSSSHSIGVHRGKARGEEQGMNPLQLQRFIWGNQNPDWELRRDFYQWKTSCSANNPAERSQFFPWDPTHGSLRWYQWIMNYPIYFHNGVTDFQWSKESHSMDCTGQGDNLKNAAHESL